MEQWRGNTFKGGTDHRKISSDPLSSASLGYPLAGDPKYGNARWNGRLKQEYGLKRQFLHAWQVEFPQMFGVLEALSGKCFTAPLPDELKRITEGERKKGKL